MAYVPKLEDIPSEDELNTDEGSYIPTSNDLPSEDELNAKEDKIKQYNESLFTPLMNTPASALATAGAKSWQQPLVRAGLETEALLPFGLGEAPYIRSLAGVAQHGFGGTLAELAGITGKNALAGGGMSALDTEDNKSLSDRVLRGMLTGGVVGGGLVGLGKAVNQLRPSLALRGNLSADQLTRNLEATEGTNTGLGRVIESPTLNRIHENILPHVIGSGAEGTMQKNASNIIDKGNQILEKIRGDSHPENLGFQIQEALKKASKDARAEKNSGYGRLNKLADEAGIKVGRNNFQEQAKNALDVINESPELKNEFSPSLYKDIQNYANNPEGNNLKLTNIFRGKLGDKANEFYASGKMYEYGLIDDLKNALGNDIQESIESSANPKIKEEYLKNQKEYAEKFAPFEDKDIVKFTRKGGDPDLILSHFLKGGKNDRAILLSKLLTKVPTTNKTIASPVTYAHLSKAIDENGQVNPIKLASLYNNLGKNQKDVLITDKSLKKELENYSNLVGKNKEAFNLMFNPKTGARNTDLLIKLSQLLGGTAAGGIPGLVASTAGSALVGRSLNKLLTSPTLREKLIKTMINGNKELPGRNIGTGAINSLFNNEGNE